MSYKVSQYNFSTSSNEKDTENFMTIVDNSDLWKAAKINTLIDSNATSILGMTNTEECVRLTQNSLNPENIYYLHAKIKRLSSDMTIYVQLTNYSTIATNRNTQYLKTINIQKGGLEEWYDFEIVFKPVTSSFDCIVFQLQRTVADFDGSGYRVPVILYEELSVIKNFKQNLIDESIIKLGVQARPGTLMCINGQEIHVGRNGIYEVRNGIVYVDYFSMVKAAIEDERVPIQGKHHQGNTLLEFLTEMAISDKSEELGGEETYNECIFSHPKKRTINAFTIDYMYEVNE